MNTTRWTPERWDRWIITSARKQKRQMREARALARRIVWYFGRHPIESFLDGDIALRDQALALLGQPMVGGAEIPTKIWKRIFRSDQSSRRIQWGVQ